MELRLDHLLAALRERPAEVLGAIDADPILLKRESGGLVLANASQELYTPQAEHQLYAKGIVYRRDPYRLVSLPLMKIYNLGERDVTVADLTGLASAPDVRLHFLRKIDGSLVQVFRHDGRVWFTTRGLIEGARVRAAAEEGEDADFDYLGAARRIAAERYPCLLDERGPAAGRTLVFELIHPRARKVTDYGDRADLVLLACFDPGRFAYAPYEEVAALAAANGLTVVDALAPTGTTVAEQIDSLLAALAGTDQEGSVLQLERGGEVVYRVKVKSPDYLRLMRLMADCTYDKTVALLEAQPQLDTWEAFQTYLEAQGRERVPEELLGFYRAHRERYLAYLADCERLRAWAARAVANLDARLGGRAGKEPAAYRKAFAALAAGRPHAGLLFATLDGRLDLARVRKLIRTPEEAREALEAVGEGRS
jgi:hypothetical protein